MSLESALYARLAGHAGLAALVGDRIYPVAAPADRDLPYVTFQRISTSRESALTGDTGIVRARVQVSAWAEDVGGSAAGFDRMRAVAEQVRDALQRWSGTAGGTVVQDSLLTGEADLYEAENSVHHGALDFEVIYEE